MITALVIMSGFTVCVTWIYMVNWALSDHKKWFEEGWDKDEDNVN